MERKDKYVGKQVLLLGLFLYMGLVSRAQTQFDLPNDGKWYKVAVMSGRHGLFEYFYSHAAGNQPSVASGSIQFINSKNHATQVHQTMGYASNNQPQFALLNLGNIGEIWVRATGNAATGNFKIVRSEYAAMVNGTVSDNNLGDNGGTVTYFERLPDNAHVFEGNAYVNGNMGIGTTTPNAKLAVNGNIRAKEVKVETANWPDYVFGVDYKLPDLKELSAYIRENRHLPGMPSAKEAEAEGIDLGEMNRKLLEKVEELTLHLLELKGELTRQSEEILTLKAFNHQ